MASLISEHHTAYGLRSSSFRGTPCTPSSRASNASRSLITHPVRAFQYSSGEEPEVSFRAFALSKSCVASSMAIRALQSAHIPTRLLSSWSSACVREELTHLSRESRAVPGYELFQCFVASLLDLLARVRSSLDDDRPWNVLDCLAFSGKQSDGEVRRWRRRRHAGALQVRIPKS